MTDQGIVLLTLLVYQLVLLAIGWLARGRNADDTDFFLGGRRLPPVVSAIGASASSSSAWTLLGVSGAAYGWGLSALWIFPACVGGFALNWYVVAPAMQRVSHRSGAVTMLETLAGRAGSDGRRPVLALGAAIVLLSLGAYVAAQFLSVGKTLGSLAGLESWQSVTLGAGVVLAYTWLGGMWAVGLTDTLQGLVMAATAVALPVAALIEVGGVGALLDGLAAVDSAGFDGPFGTRSGLVALAFVAGLLGIGLGYPGQPHVVKYFMALRDDPTSLRRARRVALGWAVAVYAGMLVLGWCGRVLLPPLPDRELVFIEASRVLFHPVVGGIMLAAVLSAIMSTADSQLLVASSTLTHDLGLGRRPGQPTSLLHSRVAVAVLTAGAAVMALVGSDRIFSRVLFAWTALGAAFGPLLIARHVLGRQISPRRALVVMAGGFLLAVAANNVRVGEYQGAAERVLPFAVACLLLALPGRRGTSA